MKANDIEHYIRGKGQRIRRKAGAATCAIRWPVSPAAPAPLKQGSVIRPAPELGGILENIQGYDDEPLIEASPLKPAREEDGIKARWRAEVWQCQNRNPVRLKEEWFATDEFKNKAAFENFICEWLKAENGKQFEKDTKILVTKGQCVEPVDVGDRARAAGLRLLENQYPQTFKAINTTRDDSTICKAYVADLWALAGRAPVVDNLEKLVSNSGFTRWLSAALAKPGKPSEPWQWQLVLGWIRDGLHALTDEELAAAMNELTGLELKPGAWRGRAKRLKLVSSLKLGRPENLNDLPPQ